MAKFVMLTTLTDEGRKTLRDKPERLREVNREVEAMGAKVLVQYALLGPYDFINILEARSKSGGMSRAPAAEEIAIEFTEPISTTNTIALSLRPNHRIASGNHVMLGSDCSPSTRLPTVSFAHPNTPMHTPTDSPITIASE